MKNKGYGSPKIDVWIQGSMGKPAIRGREQQVMDYYGGVGSSKLGYSIRGVSKNNPAGRFFHYESNRHFGKLAPYTGY